MIEREGFFARQFFIPALTNFKDKFVFIIGGGYDSRGVLRYDFDQNIVNQMPKLNRVRRFASACSLGDAIYVYGGMNPEKKESSFVSSIEMLTNCGASEYQPTKPWVLMKLPNANGVNFPMTRGIFMPINSHEIAIIGRRGYTSEDYLFSCVFDTRAGTFKSSFPKRKFVLSAEAWH